MLKLRQYPWCQRYLNLRNSDFIIAAHNRLPSNRLGGYKLPSRAWTLNGWATRSSEIPSNSAGLRDSRHLPAKMPLE
jgi:hypothetical protein